MRKNRHNKIKNTGILFELLTRQITSDFISNKPSPAADILKTFFKSGTNLHKELRLYQTLMKEKYSSEAKATSLIEEVIKLSNVLNRTNLRKEKYNLIKEIRAYYDLDDFIKTQINNYKVYASIYRLLENKNFTFSPAEIVTSRYTLLEFITSKPIENKTVRTGVINEYSKQDADVRKLAYKILIDRFNSKYKNLGDREKQLLREYINTISDSPKMKEFIDSELESLVISLRKSAKRVTDPVIRIKLHEVYNIIEDIKSKKKFSENNLLTLMNIYKLDDQLKKN